MYCGGNIASLDFVTCLWKHEVIVLKFEVHAIVNFVLIRIYMVLLMKSTYISGFDCSK
jgi:hypothetical protein